MVTVRRLPQEREGGMEGNYRYILTVFELIFYFLKLSSASLNFVLSLSHCPWLTFITEVVEHLKL